MDGSCVWFGRDYRGADGCEWWRHLYLSDLSKPRLISSTDCGLCVVCINRAFGRKVGVAKDGCLTEIRTCCYPQEAGAYAAWYQKRRYEMQ